MADEWQEVQLGDVVDLLTGYPFKSQYYTEDAADPRVLGGDNIVQGALRWDTVRRWPRRMVEQWLDPYWLHAGDVVLAMDRPWIEAGLKRAGVGPGDLPALLVQRTARLRGTDRLDGGFLRYLIGSREFTQYVLAVQTGTAVPHISPAQIKGFRFKLPPAHLQRAIAHILGTLDDKIDLNRRMAATLEEMARALFREHLLSRPDGKWSKVSLSSIAHFQNGLALQKYPVGEGAGLPAIKIAQLRAGNTEGADIVSADLPEAARVFDGDVVFSWSGTLECRIWAGGPGALNQHLFKVTSKQFPRWFYNLWILEHLPAFRSIAADKATTMGHINRTHLDAAQVLVPAPAVLAQLDSVLAPILARAHLARLESRTLTDIRDTILPKLISGQLSIRSAERLLESPT